MSGVRGEVGRSGGTPPPRAAAAAALSRCRPSGSTAVAERCSPPSSRRWTWRWRRLTRVQAVWEVTRMARAAATRRVWGMVMALVPLPCLPTPPTQYSRGYCGRFHCGRGRRRQPHRRRRYAAAAGSGSASDGTRGHDGKAGHVPCFRGLWEEGGEGASAPRRTCRVDRAVTPPRRG